MKKIFAILAFIALALSLTACSKAPDSSSQSDSDSGIDDSSIVQSGNSSLSNDTSTSKSSSPDSNVSSEGWPTSFVSARDSNGEIVLVELQAPVAWQFDGTSTFFENDIKMLEITGLEPITDKANPFEAANKDQYVKTPEGMPEGFGYIRTDKIELPSCKAVLHLWKTWPDDSDKPWYPHNYFVEKDNYLVMASFYAPSEDCTALHKVYDVILDGMVIFK